MCRPQNIYLRALGAVVAASVKVTERVRAFGHANTLPILALAPKCTRSIASYAAPWRLDLWCRTVERKSDMTQHNKNNSCYVGKADRRRHSAIQARATNRQEFLLNLLSTKRRKYAWLFVLKAFFRGCIENHDNGIRA